MGREPSHFASMLDALQPHQVFELGQIPAVIVRHWGSTSRSTSAILTGERWRHITVRHPEVLWVCDDLPMLLVEPDEVHRNLSQHNIAIFYRLTEHDRFLRAAVAMQQKAGTFKHSMLSCRLCRVDELIKGEARRVYRR